MLRGDCGVLRTHQRALLVVLVFSCSLCQGCYYPFPISGELLHPRVSCLSFSTAIIMPMISPYTQYASMINKATPYNYPGEQGPILGGGEGEDISV